ncbi:piRNA biogenesis protein EXD1 isoform X2 [Dunckerocampus dactyliophorus]|uniref:piRNA biogenesis protein EXD1 isoform X2 n=1 Tax=Dunckerocampus dactyliophorus TaxID=161453 RepID=UPI00240701BF|nr:piRNA biogenesis protein EXD1 isoform X2 [Dunckerocampus dactyliophorus]
MFDDDANFINIFRGKRIKLTLRTSSYLGVVQRIDANKALVLTEVINGGNCCKISGSRLFFGRDILNVEFTDEEDTEHGNIPEDLEEHLKVKKFQPYRKSVYHDEDEECINFEVIDEFHDKFGSAVMNIKKQHVVGVGADGVAMYNHGRLCWLQIATKNKVYLFDILLLGARAFKNGLSMILENKHILKVIHDCRAIAGSLMTQFGIKLMNVFDTQVADVMCFHSETGGFLPDRVSTLHEVVGLHLKVPSSQLLSLKTKSQLTKEETELWYKRPCPTPMLKVLALSVIHLQPLRLVLLDTLLTDYMTLVDTYLTNSQYPLDNLESINMESVFELPSELRQLEQMRLERRECAAKHYPVTDEGLLTRFSPETGSPIQTTPVEEEHKCTGPTEESPAPEADQKHPFTHLFDVNDVASVNEAAQDPASSTLSAPRRQIPFSTPPSRGVGRGFTALLMGVMGRGRHFGKEQSASELIPPHHENSSTNHEREKWGQHSLWD